MGSVSLSQKKKKVVKKRSKAHKLNIKSGRAKIKEFKKAKNERRKKIRYRGKAQGLIYIGHIPHGFYEDEMKSYFDQFGKVISATLIRSKKTGRSRGYGFVEFKDEEVAKIAAETMNNYLMFNRIIKCRYIPPEERKNRVFARKITSTDYPRKRNRISNMKNKMKALSNSNQSTYLKRTQKKINEFKQFFEERGINFTFKITNKSSEDNDKDSMNEENERKSSLNIDLKSKPKEEVDDQFGVLEIDESDDDIYFKTPPQVKKIIKCSSNNPVATVKVIAQCDNSPTRKAKKINKLKKLNSNKSQEKKQSRNKSIKTKEGLSPVIQKQKRMKKNEKSLVKSVKAKKKPVEKNILNAVKKKNEKTQKKVSNLTISQKKSKLS